MRTLSMAIILGLFGAIAVYVSNEMEWPTWVLFITWVSYYLFGKSPRALIWPFIQIMMGIAMGVLIRLSVQWLGNTAWSMPLAVFFFIGSLAYFGRYTKLNNIPAWFLGLIVFFGAHPPLDFSSIISLLVPLTAGLLFAWLNDSVLQKLVPAGK